MLYETVAEDTRAAQSSFRPVKKVLVDSDRSGATVLHRAVQFLELFELGRATLTLSEISRLTGVPTPSAYRILKVLTDVGMLERDEVKRYRVGVKLWELGTRSSRLLQLRETAMPFMEDLQAGVGQHTQLAVLVDGEVLIVERLSSHNYVPNISRIGGRLPLHASSPGLLLLAHASIAEREQYLEGPLDKFTTETETDLRRLSAELSRIKSQGYAVAEGTINPDGSGVAAPIYDSHRKVVASLSITYPRGAVSHHQLLPALITTTRSISRQL